LNRFLPLALRRMLDGFANTAERQRFNGQWPDWFNFIFGFFPVGKRRGVYFRCRVSR
jgi:hypothetical protein